MGTKCVNTQVRKFHQSTQVYSIGRSYIRSTASGALGKLNYTVHVISLGTTNLHAIVDDRARRKRRHKQFYP